MNIEPSHSLIPYTNMKYRLRRKGPQDNVPVKFSIAVITMIR